MPKPPAIKRPISGSSDVVMQTLAWMRKNGFKAVPLHRQSKAAMSRDYVRPDYQPPDDDTWRRNELGIGIVTGPANSGPVDIDLDCEEALFFAKCFLPPTPAVFGRTSKRRSHYLYRVESSGFEKRAYNDPSDNSTIIEARGDGGHQTVAPGSIHEGTGEVIEWDGTPFPDVPVVDSGLLVRSVQKVAIATLIARHIWKEGYHNSPTKHLTGLFFYLEWSVEEVEEMVQALMDYSNDDDKSRIPTVRATYRRGAAGKKISGAGVLRKELHNNPIVDKLLEWAGSPTINLLQEYNDRFAAVTVAGKFRIACTDNKPSEPPTFMLKEDFLNTMSTDYTEIEVDGKIKKVSKAQVWLKSPRRRSYSTVDFMPGEDDDGKTLNLWSGWAVEPRPPTPEGGCEAFLELLRDIVCGGNEELNQWMLHWLANIVREPMQKSLTAPVVIGVEGAGKSLMVGYFGVILGSQYTVVTQDSHIYGQFNSHLSGTLLLHSEEALYGGDQKHASIIRSLITDEWRMFEPKGIDAKKVRNYLRLILLSNKSHAAPVMPGDRRYTVIDMKKRKASDELIRRVLKEKRLGGPSALLHHLLNMDYDPELPRINVKNRELAAAKEQNLEPIPAWWLEVLMSGQLLPDPLSNWAQKPEREFWPEVVGFPTLYAAMETALKRRNVRVIPHQVAFSSLLDKMLGVDARDRPLHRGQRHFQNILRGEMGIPQNWAMLGDRQLALLNFPCLDDARKSFESYLGQSIEWPAEDAVPVRPGKRVEHDKY